MDRPRAERSLGTGTAVLAVVEVAASLAQLQGLRQAVTLIAALTGGALAVLGLLMSGSRFRRASWGLMVAGVLVLAVALVNITTGWPSDGRYTPSPLRTLGGSDAATATDAAAATGETPAATDQTASMSQPVPQLGETTPVAPSNVSTDRYRLPEDEAHELDGGSLVLTFTGYSLHGTTDVSDCVLSSTSGDVGYVRGVDDFWYKIIVLQQDDLDLIIRLEKIVPAQPMDGTCH